MVKAGAGGRRVIEQLDPAARAGRHHHRRRQHPLRDTERRTKKSSRSGAAVHRHRRLRRRRGALKGPSIMPGGSEEPGRTSSRSSRRSPPRSARTATSPAANGSGRAAPGTTSRWCTTASSTATCSSSARPTSCSSRPWAERTTSCTTSSPSGTKGELESYLIEITRDIFSVKDDETATATWSTRSSTRPGQGDRQVDEPARPRPGRAQHAGHRSRLCPLPLGP
jgi:6-phosphogluconate dehydrogenase